MTSSLLHNSPTASSFLKKTKQNKQSDDQLKTPTNFSNYANPNMSASSIHSQGRPGGGWDEIDVDISKTPSLNSLNEDNSHENKLIDDVIQPGGVRLRQSEIVLEGFCKTCESLDVGVIGSILMSKLNSGITWVSKTRAIFAIEALCKKSASYLAYFKSNALQLRQVPSGRNWQNVQQLNSALEGLIRVLQGQNQAIICNKENLNQVNKTLKFENLCEKPSMIAKTAISSQNQDLKKPQLPAIKQQTQNTSLNEIKTTSVPSKEVLKPEAKPIFIEHKPIGPPKGVAASLPDLSISKDEITYPGEQASSLIASLSDLDFTGSPIHKNENDIYHLYKSTDPVSAPEEIAMNLQMRYPQNYYNPYVQNQWPMGNFSNNDNCYGFNQSQQQRMIDHNNSPQQPESDQFEDFDGPSKVLKEGYVDPEEIQKIKEREAIEKKFESLRF